METERRKIKIKELIVSAFKIFVFVVLAIVLFSIVTLQPIIGISTIMSVLAIEFLMIDSEKSKSMRIAEIITLILLIIYYVLFEVRAFSYDTLALIAYALFMPIMVIMYYLNQKALKLEANNKPCTK